MNQTPYHTQQHNRKADQNSDAQNPGEHYLKNQELVSFYIYKRTLSLERSFSAGEGTQPLWQLKLYSRGMEYFIVCAQQQQSNNGNSLINLNRSLKGKACWYA